MTDNEALQFYTQTPKLTHAPGLAVMATLMARLGNPQDGLRCVHIAGTNGKGSCAAMTAAVLRAAGYKTGLFTSPDLTGLWERISVGGVYINTSALTDITRQVRDACKGLEEPSFFEKITAAAFLYFRQQGCGRVVLETGLGGRLDATNIIKNPVCSIITPIGYDHTALLGDTLSAISREKAGIIKPGCPAVSAPQEPAAAEVLSAAAVRCSAPLHVVDIKNISYLSAEPFGQRFSYGALKDVFLPLLGDHQVINACTVAEAARAMSIGEDALRAGLRAARWPCRFEPVPGDPPFLLDGAHNPHGAAALASGLWKYFPGVRFTMIMGVMADKDFQGMLDIMEPLAAEFICLTPDGGARSLPADVLAGLVKTVPAREAKTPGQALTLARASGRPVCAFGSLYYIGQLRRLLLEET